MTEHRLKLIIKKKTRVDSDRLLKEERFIRWMDFFFVFVGVDITVQQAETPSIRKENV